jgi:hypothetical protein
MLGIAGVLVVRTGTVAPVLVWMRDNKGVTRMCL